ncbi:glycoside hydrolase family 62 protein [Cucurbitaria berberidis CBS 394.84]|uniref:Alpha-L-arabinofuranosidase n=1 Tax=Cucurbitaria berberidis CBS 394.84 TaxID=1168544 RepID=A0A9P4L3K5_9PLEO|nr:glycoside hydrolase family 62 protein [Cucurbitaria berberidis CBS 394.84]KAF1840412.1 glycoside hydrolase family 62 protein [Cucurbitaria berberidis CBS 394.84]
MFSFVLLALVATVAARSHHLRDSASSIISRQKTTLPSTFKWASSDILVAPKNDARNIAAIKDPSIIHYNNAYHVFASTAVTSGYNLVYFNFTSFATANAAPFYYLDQSAIGAGYRAAPEVFYFAPQKLWYLIYQNGNAAYSTNKDISDPHGWTAPKNFYNGTPPLIQQGLEGGYWVDMWVICDETDCHLFSSDDNGRLYRSQTPVSKFPNGMSEPVIALKDNKNDLFEASNVYAIGNSAKPTYLLLVECIGAGSSPGGQRYFRSWTSSSLSGPWNALAATQQNPFMGEANVKFTNGNKWSKSISHGEIVRSNVDQRLRIGDCGWEYMYQGIDPAASSANYNNLPWKLGVLKQEGGC